MLEAMHRFTASHLDGWQAVAVAPQRPFDELGITDLELGDIDDDSVDEALTAFASSSGRACGGDFLLACSLHSRSLQEGKKLSLSDSPGGVVCAKACPSAPRLSPTAAPAGLPPLADAALLARAGQCEAQPLSQTLSAIRWPTARGKHLETPISGFYLALDAQVL